MISRFPDAALTQIRWLTVCIHHRIVAAVFVIGLVVLADCIGLKVKSTLYANLIVFPVLAAS
jgi:hypothetical protein